MKMLEMVSRIIVFMAAFEIHWTSDKVGTYWMGCGLGKNRPTRRSYHDEET
jgi:hypothetical protein